MQITILTLFPEVFTPIFSTSILKHAQEKKLVEVNVVNIRDFAEDKHKTVDDKPYGGGVGMVMRVDILAKAIHAACHPREGGDPINNKPYSNKWIPGQARNDKEKVVLLDPKGKQYTQVVAKEYSTLDHLILVCGHYEGVDARIERYIDERISIGDFILTGGEIPAMGIADSIIRLIPGVLPKGATISETFEENFIEFPQYTRPDVFEGQKVPQVLLSGNHKEIENWRKEQQIASTKKLRPDLLKGEGERVKREGKRLNNSFSLKGEGQDEGYTCSDVSTSP